MSPGLWSCNGATNQFYNIELFRIVPAIETFDGFMNIQTTAPQASGESLLRIEQVEAKIGLRRSSIYQRVRGGTFPAPLRLSHKVSRWRSSEIEAWITEQIARAQ